MAYFGMLCRVVLVRTDVSEELTRATRRNIQEDAILHSHRGENLKSYKLQHCFEDQVKDHHSRGIHTDIEAALRKLLPRVPRCSKRANLLKSRHDRKKNSISPSEHICATYDPQNKQPGFP
jgi:hypothetical protein